MSDEPGAANGNSAVAVGVPDLAADPTGWVGSQGKGVLKKVSYAVLEWLYKTVGKSDPVPGAKKQETTGKEFLGVIKDGSLLCDLANKLQPGAVQSVHKAEENATLEAEKQKENQQNFLSFAKDKAGVKESDLFKPDDLESPKGLPAVLATLTSLGAGAKEKFGVEGLNVESLMKMAAESGAKNFVMGLINRIFKKNNSSPADNAVVEEVKVQESKAANGENQAPVALEHKDQPSSPEKSAPNDCLAKPEE